MSPSTNFDNVFDTSGLWHCKYVEPAQRLLPYCRLAHIGISPSLARKYFWEACSAFSLNYATLVGKEGAEFRAACKVAKKDLYVWTVNDRREMIQATKWGVKAILTDKTAEFLSLRDQMSSKYLIPQTDCYVHYERVVKG